ncbi:MAG TPA: hypothetical protein VK196_01470 [Magnetospirillum sp.]|nr:hypothetical protein [Magnetospirillum sp.]
MPRALRLGRAAGALMLAAGLAACQTTREQEVEVKPEVAHAYLADKPVELRRHFMVALAQGKRNQVLNDMRLGLASMELGRTALAEQLFDDALANIETIYADNPAAARAREAFTKESAKDFKGEPYERAMAYYYRGLLYLREGDYDNARASFKGGFIQDSFADEDQNRADFGLLQYLQGWASHCRGNTVTADEDFKEFQAINGKFPLPGKDDNVLVLAETGGAPIKFSQGDANSSKPKYLRFRRMGASETVRLSFAEPPKNVSRTVELGQLENIYFQASTRGGREFDSILAGKAQFKTVSGAVGDAALIGAAVAGGYALNTYDRRNQRDAVAAAGALLLVGLLAKSIAEATEADADTRYWDNLPERVHATTLTLPNTVDKLSVDFLAADGEVLRTREAAITRAGTCGIAWVRGTPAVPANPRAPYSAPRDTMYMPVVIPPRPAEAASPLPGDKPAQYAPKPEADPAAAPSPNS